MSKENYLKQKARDLSFIDQFIVCSNDFETRYKGSSGGFVSELVRNLFVSKKIASAISFSFCNQKLYSPKIIYDYSEWYQSGSIYHDTDLLSFIKRNICHIKSPILITCLPCECRAIRSILKKKGIKCLLVSLFCSGQLTKQATFDFLSKHDIDKVAVKDIRYRGNGWPSGIQVDTYSGRKYFFDLLASEWKYYFHSGLYNLEKCFRCNDTFGRFADISVGDPWLKDIIQKDKIGFSLVCVSKPELADLVNHFIKTGVLILYKKVTPEEVITSQLETVTKKEIYCHFKTARILFSFFRTSFYRNLFLLNNIQRFHFYMVMKILKYYRRLLYAKSCNN